jgi:hypothetical protein
LNALFSFTLEAWRDPEGLSTHGLRPFYSEKDSFLTHYIAGKSVYCSPPWYLAVQYVEHIRTSHDKSSMNTKTVIVLPRWPQFNATTIGLKLLRHVPIDIPVFTKPHILGKRYAIVKALWPISYWVTHKDTLVKYSSTRVQSMVSAIDIDNTTNQSEIAARWFIPTSVTLTLMVPNQSEPLMKLPISIWQDSLHYRTSVLIDLAGILNFASHDVMTRNNLIGECTSSPKSLFELQMNRDSPRLKYFHPRTFHLVRKGSQVSILQFHHILNVWILSLVY